MSCLLSSNEYGASKSRANPEISTGTGHGSFRELASLILGFVDDKTRKSNH
jgi:hypothetical protein